jgi:5-methyltetrahydrofolate--homocysteine methyltransferase
MLKSLADRLPEAFAERLHQHVRTELGAMRRTDICRTRDLIKERYRGIAPAPRLPRLAPSIALAMLMSCSVVMRPASRLTESFAMLPASAVSGFYFAHPESAYFGVARIGQDQLEDYAERRGVDVDTAARWLRPNLD